VRVVLQRVEKASVSVGGVRIGEVGRGHLLLVGFTQGDGPDQIAWMTEKIMGLRVFPDDAEKMNLSLDDISGDLLVVSQFTLYGDTTKGRRPSFVRAAPPDIAIPLYESFVQQLKGRSVGRVETGEFGANMAVELVNDGPVTLVLERE
jgi:D-tyrosyl-tRNA(Tyr) deacylase|tara:strand:+ start:459 stop:902 length:444 start_codon:yes stop_codon:yes gene_type:complete